MHIHKITYGRWSSSRPKSAWTQAYERTRVHRARVLSRRWTLAVELLCGALVLASIGLTYLTICGGR